VTPIQRTLAGAVLATAAAITACGGGSSPTSPSGGSGTSGGPGPSGATITIGSNGAISPSQVTISVGQSVTFINNHSRGHNMSSDPHPAHTDCAQVNAVGSVAVGQTKLTNAFTAARTCGFHDHNEPDNSALMGRIIIQ
jgi:plastocyanin